MGIFSKKADRNKYLHGFAKTNDSLVKKLRFITENKTQNKEDFMEQLMVTLIEADIGYRTSEEICDRFFETCQNYYYLFSKDIMRFLGETFKDIYYEKTDTDIKFNENGPTVILMVGVNGSGKTSTCAKLANRYLSEGKKVALAAGDTFRAGAIQQLQKWADELNVPCICGKENADPSSVLVDACR